jgi:hypothetical protein
MCANQALFRIKTRQNSGLGINDNAQVLPGHKILILKHL